MEKPTKEDLIKPFYTIISAIIISVIAYFIYIYTKNTIITLVIPIIIMPLSFLLICYHFERKKKKRERKQKKGVFGYRH